MVNVGWQEGGKWSFGHCCSIVDGLLKPPLLKLFGIIVIPFIVHRRIPSAPKSIEFEYGRKGAAGRRDGCQFIKLRS